MRVLGGCDEKRRCLNKDASSIGLRSSKGMQHDATLV